MDIGNAAALDNRDLTAWAAKFPLSVRKLTNLNEAGPNATILADTTLGLEFLGSTKHLRMYGVYDEQVSPHRRLGSH
jgi:hypothetical protein